MGKMTKKEMPMWAKTGHRKPTTRREFLAAGLIPFTANMLMPGLVGLLASPMRAFAAEPNCPDTAGVLPSFVTINLSGGAGLSGNFIPRDAGGQLLPSYTKIGGGTSGNIQLAPDLAVGNQPGPFGANVGANGSTAGFLLGLRAGAPTALANTSVVGVCVQSRDDAADNAFDASGMVYKAGLVGSMLPNMGTANTPTGIQQQAALVSPPTPLVVRSVNDIANSIGYTAALRNLTADQRLKVARLVSSLSNSQAAKLNAMPATAQVQSLVQCAGIRNQELMSANGAPPLPATVAAAFGNPAANNQQNVYANMVYNSLAGNGGVVNINLGGYDYHDGSRTTGDNMDTQAGTLVGRVLESAKAMNKKIFVYVTSDGATTSNDSNTPGAAWVSDRGTGGLAMFFLFDPAARPVTNGLQIGNYTAGQVANDGTFVGSEPAQAAQAVFANYMKFAGRMDLFEKVIPSSAPLSGAVLNGVLRV